MTAFSDFLTAIHECKSGVAETLHDRLCDHVIDEFFSNSIDEVDELSTHHCVDEICIEEVRLVEILERYIDIEVEGEVYVEMQYGSSSDLRNDNGVVINKSFPFQANVRISAFDPDKFKVLDYHYNVDTSSWSE